MRNSQSGETYTMQEIICNVDDVIFDIEISLELQLGAQPLPFEGMDSTVMIDILIIYNC